GVASDSHKTLGVGAAEVPPPATGSEGKRAKLPAGVEPTVGAEDPPTVPEDPPKSPRTLITRLSLNVDLPAAPIFVDSDSD
ncbi:hypothetical protein ScalyP_jg1816, partial [Parmales sp. scaly parma]